MPDVARWAGRAIVMPNLTPPVLSVSDALRYRERILAHVPEGGDFDPLMVLYLTDTTTSDMVAEAAESPCVQGIKLYPAGATTNSDAGVTGIEACIRFEAMERHDVPLLIHGEVTDPHVDIFDREKAFIDSALTSIVGAFPALRIVFEHITTADAVQFVEASGEYIAATVTAHHLLYNRNDMLVGGVRPHLFCLPVLKRDQHQLALRRAVTSGHPRFFLGTDSAPHARGDKESSCGCAGCYTAHAALSCMRKSLTRRTRWIASRRLRASTGQTFTAYRETAAPSRLPKTLSPYPRRSVSATVKSCRYVRVTAWAGPCPANDDDGFDAPSGCR